jgi:antitoxin ParD1/3/4
MATMNVSLPDPMKEWVESRMKDGKFSNTSDYVRHLIRRDQERAEAVAEIQKAVDEAIASGEPRPFDFKAFKARMHEQHGRR